MPPIPSNTFRGAILADRRAALLSAPKQELWPGHHSCQTEDMLFPTARTMAFKNEVVSDADIDRYKLPFQKGDGRWWTRDAERDYYLWGGISGDLAYDALQIGRFHLYADGDVYGFILRPGEFSSSLKETPYIVRWEGVTRIVPEPRSEQQKMQLISILKEALIVYGLHGEIKPWPVDIRVKFSF